MKPQVFVSHSSQDKEAVAKLCADLQECGVDTWASTKDIPPGTVWNKAIEEALHAATHILVVASQASIASDYVGAEVEWALNNGKKVIPVLVENVKMPVRWHTLQYADLTPSENQEAAWQALVDQLPKNTRSQFLSLLDADAPAERIREFLWKIPRVISHSAISQSEIKELLDFHFRPVVTIQDDVLHPRGPVTRWYVRDFVVQQNLIGVLANADFFDARPHTLFRYKLVYLLDTAPPFDENGSQTNELKKRLGDAEEAISAPNFIVPASSPHRAGAEITTVIVAGRRHHYQGSVLEQRHALIEQWASGEWKKKILSRLRSSLDTKGMTEEISYRTQLDFVSYDHLLERI